MMQHALRVLCLGAGVVTTAYAAGEAGPTAPPAGAATKLPWSGLKVHLPEGAAMVDDHAYADGIWIGGAPPKAYDIVRVREPIPEDADLDSAIRSAKANPVFVYQADVSREGSGRAFTYVYRHSDGFSVIKRLQVGKKEYSCFGTVKSEAAAKTARAVCDSLSE